MTKTIAVIIGSLRRESIARKIGKNVMKMFPSGYEAKIVEIRDLPLYDCDYDDPQITDKPVPQEYEQFRDTIKAADAVMFVTAENNRCVPACIKNAVDIGSKPANDAVWKGLPCAIISHSVGKMGGYSSHKNLKLALSYFSMPMVLQPEVFLAQSNTLIDEKGNINNPSTIEFLQGYVNDFVQVIEKNPKA